MSPSSRSKALLRARVPPLRLKVSNAWDQSVTASIVWNRIARADGTTAPAMSQLMSALARPSDKDLAALVTRDSMIGVGPVRRP